MALRQREVFAKRIPLYRKDPCLFFKEVTGFKPDPWQKEAATAIAQHRKVSIRSGQGVGKTAFEANLVLWFLSCFPYPRVVCTAPTRQQLNDVLWAEIAKWQERSPVLQAMLVWTKTRVYMRGHEKRWFAVARTATKPENMQGFHEDNMLFVVDEASGVADPIMEAIQGTLSGDNNRLLMCGNPTQNTGTFHDSHTVDAQSYYCMKVSSRDSPRTNKQNIADLERKFGKNSNVVRVRVDGEFPENEDDVFIPMALATKAVNTEPLEHCSPARISIGCDVARFGNDDTAIAQNIDGDIQKLVTRHGQSLSVAGVKDILDNACAMLSAVSHIPQTRLFGRSPAGENATGESDLENYKEFVGGIQSGDLRDNTRTLVELVLRGMTWSGEIKEVPEYTVTYKSAWSPSDDEKATQDQAVAAAQLARAQTASTYVTNGILEATEVRRALVQDEQFDPENILTETDLNQEQDWGLTDARGQIPTSGDFSRQENPIVTDEGDFGYVAGFVLNDGRILCGRRSDGQGWCGPGGHIEPGETPSVAFRREAKEEFNIDVGNITYLGNCKGKPDEALPVQIYLVNGFDGVPRCDQKEMFTATWMPPEQILKQDVPGGLVFEPFLRSVKEYLDQLGITLDDFDESKHNRDEDGKFSNSGGSISSKDASSKENSSKDLNDSRSHAKINSNAVSAKGANTFKVKGFPNKQKLNNHWQNGRTHAAEYAPDGITTKEQYEKRAVQLLESSCGNGIKGYKTKEGLVCRYDTKKNDFAKGSPEKGVRTMFKPDDGEDYYKRQLELEGIEDD